MLTAWIAVRWHRFVLMEERPSGAVPPWNGALVRAYLVRSLKIALVVLAAGIGLSLALLVVLLLPPGIAAPLATAGGLLLTVALIAVSLRIGLSLPAAALGRRTSTAESWRETAPASGAILVLAAIDGTAGLRRRNPDGRSRAARGATARRGSLLVGWAQLMLSVAVLTTLYGHLVEGRALG